MDAQYISKTYDFDTNDLKLKGFKVYEIEPAVNPVPSYNRRDFYKICLVTGNSLIHYADKSVEMKGALPRAVCISFIRGRIGSSYKANGKTLFPHSGERVP